MPVQKDFSVCSQNTPSCFYSYWDILSCSVFHCYGLSQILYLLWLVTFSISFLSICVLSVVSLVVVNLVFPVYITMAGMPCQKKKRRRKKKARQTWRLFYTLESCLICMKLAVCFSFPTIYNKNPMIPSWSLVSIYNYSFNPDQIFTKNFKILELEICSKIFTCGMIFLQVNSSLPTSLKKMC